jgi:hypothetical protein
MRAFKKKHHELSHYNLTHCFSNQAFQKSLPTIFIPIIIFLKKQHSSPNKNKKFIVLLLKSSYIKKETTEKNKNF